MSLLRLTDRAEGESEGVVVVWGGDEADFGERDGDVEESMMAFERTTCAQLELQVRKSLEEERGWSLACFLDWPPGKLEIGVKLHNYVLNKLAFLLLSGC